MTAVQELPFQAHSATSEAAAKSMEPHAGSLRAAVLDWLRVRGNYGCTDDELFLWIAGSQNAIRPRRVELVKSGLVKDSGTTRKTRSGRAATVWISA